MQERPTYTPVFANRDLSWLMFNRRILSEAQKNNVPILERIKFLAIFSSNLDEFYRVRMPILLALKRMNKNEVDSPNALSILNKAFDWIKEAQNEYGLLLKNEIIPCLKANNIYWLYNESIPGNIYPEVLNYFQTQVLAYLKPVHLIEQTNFFPENNQLYFLIQVEDQGTEKFYSLNIPSDVLPRFYTTTSRNLKYVVFLDDIIRTFINYVFVGAKVLACYSFKVTRDAEIDLKDEYPGSISKQIENQLRKRDFGLATRFLYQNNIPEGILLQIKRHFNLKNASLVPGGAYHNLKDLFSFPIKEASLSDISWPSLSLPLANQIPVHEAVQHKDVLISTPYQNYDTILRYFNEAAIDPTTTEIYTTLYRVAKDSKIASALISAAKNGKKVMVLVELKARFDEENNILWAKKMKAAGVQVLYSVVALKVHAKITLVKRSVNGRTQFSGLISTGNFNERTATTYTDHILITAHKGILREMDLLFIFLAKRVKPSPEFNIRFKHLLVAQFNLLDTFIALIAREMEQAKNGFAASITIKINNLEETVLINKLYEASNCGVKIHLIVRSICCLVPGIIGQSENIKVTRVVDRYLEHSRVFVFNNGGQPEVFMGSADWMERNIYRRIEVCIPIYDQDIKKELLTILNFTATDNVQAVEIDKHLNNMVVKEGDVAVHSQLEIYNYLKNKAQNHA